MEACPAEPHPEAESDPVADEAVAEEPHDTEADLLQSLQEALKPGPDEASSEPATEAASSAAEASVPEAVEPSRAQVKAALYAILRVVDFATTGEKSVRKMLQHDLGVSKEFIDAHRAFIKKHVSYVVDNMDERDTLAVLPDSDEEVEEKEKEGAAAAAGGKEEKVVPGEGEEIEVVAAEGEEDEAVAAEGEEEEEDEEAEASQPSKNKAAKKKRAPAPKKKRGTSADDGDGDTNNDVDAGSGGGGGGEAAPRKKRKAAAEAAAMDAPGGLGEYDPRRAEVELQRRQEARQDIKAAHKALILATSGDLGPLYDVMSAADGWDTRQLLIQALSQAEGEALEALAADTATLALLAGWLKDGAEEGQKMEHLVCALLRLLARMPSLRRGGGSRAAGLPAIVGSLADDARSRDVRAQAATLLASWRPASVVAAEAALVAQATAAKAASRAQAVRAASQGAATHATAQPQAQGVALPGGFSRPQAQAQPAQGQAQQPSSRQGAGGNGGASNGKPEPHPLTAAQLLLQQRIAAATEMIAAIKAEGQAKAAQDSERARQAASATLAVATFEGYARKTVLAPSVKPARPVTHKVKDALSMRKAAPPPPHKAAGAGGGSSHKAGAGAGGGSSLKASGGAGGAASHKASGGAGGGASLQHRGSSGAGDKAAAAGGGAASGRPISSSSKPAAAMALPVNQPVGLNELDLYVKKMLGDALKAGSIDMGAYAKIKDKVLAKVAGANSGPSQKLSESRRQKVRELVTGYVDAYKGSKLGK
ncbi:hypothetical protein FOA52_015607 [Chlamydomonas sp. UWO 241]|nr:hypothetical protein FOA52_015607 [Chlamydomonas sp. UWO 241]